jgi:hypothetical protein
VYIKYDIYYNTLIVNKSLHNLKEIDMKYTNKTMIELLAKDIAINCPELESSTHVVRDGINPDIYSVAIYAPHMRILVNDKEMAVNCASHNESFEWKQHISYYEIVNEVVTILTDERLYNKSHM